MISTLPAPCSLTGYLHQIRTSSNLPPSLASLSWKRSSSLDVFMERRLLFSWLITVLAMFSLNFWRLSCVCVCVCVCVQLESIQIEICMVLNHGNGDLIMSFEFGDVVVKGNSAICIDTIFNSTPHPKSVHPPPPLHPLPLHISQSSPHNLLLQCSFGDEAVHIHHPLLTNSVSSIHRLQQAQR